MSSPIVSQAFRRFHQVADECVKEVMNEVFRQHGASFVFKPVDLRIALMECGSDPFNVVITQVTGTDGDLKFFGHPEFCENEAQDWDISDVYAAEDQLALLASFLDPAEWKRTR